MNSIPEVGLTSLNIRPRAKVLRTSSLEPSKKLIRVLSQLAFSDDALILDAPSGFGRNVLALADRGYDVIAVDKDLKRLGALKQLLADQPRLRRHNRERRR